MAAQNMFNYIAKQVKAVYLNVTELELKVLEATNEQPWGPTGSEMTEIARQAEDRDNYAQIMNVLHQRLMEKGDKWRLCYKALLVLDFLCKQGPLRVADDLLRSVHILERLRDMFEYKDENGRDQGINVRERAKALVMLVNSPQKLSEERVKAAKNSGKYKGVSAEDMKYGSGGLGGGVGGFGGGGGGGGGSKYGGFGSSGGSNQYNSYGAVGASTSGTGATSAAAGSASNLEEDPFEATRKRIEKLKADGAISSNAPREEESFEPTFRDLPPEGDHAKKGPKKLSEVKINPQFATTFATMAQKQGVAPAKIPALGAPPSAGGTSGLMGRGVSSPPPPPAAAPADPFADFLMDATPAAPAAAATTSMASSDPFATFDAAPAPAPAPAPPQAASKDPFSAMMAPPMPAAPVTQPASAAADPFSDFSVAPVLSSMPQVVQTQPAVRSDPFSTFAPGPTIALLPPTASNGQSNSFGAFSAGCGMGMGASSDPFGDFTPISAPAPAAPAGGFVNLVQGMGGFTTGAAPDGLTVHALGGPPSCVQGLGSGAMNGAGPEKPKAKDPFAGLGFD